MIPVEHMVMAILGGITRVLIHAKKAKDIARYEVFKNGVIGFIGGIVYSFMVETWGAPDTVVVFFFSYAFSDIIDNITKKVLGKIMV